MKARRHKGTEGPILHPFVPPCLRAFVPLDLHFPMHPDDNVCLCYKVSLRKLVHYLNREKPVVASQLSDCLSAGTGCQWCVPFLKKLHAQWEAGERPDLPIAPEEYARRRREYKRTGVRGSDGERESDGC